MNELATQTVDDVAEQLAEHQLDWDRIRDRLHLRDGSCTT